MKKAFEIAKENLENCFRDGGIIASIDHFSDFWARDSFYASWGLLVIGETKRVKTNLELYIRYQKSDGQIARRIDRSHTWLSYLKIHIARKNLHPKYTGAYIFPAMDPNCLFVITAFKYFQETNDLEFLRQNFQSLLSAINWLEKNEKDGLIFENVFANWMDVIIKKGSVFYTNILYAEALKNFSAIAETFGKKDLAQNYLEKFNWLKNILNEKFWNGEYFIDWINGNKKYDYFSSDGNLLAIIFDVTNQNQTEKILKFIAKNNLDTMPLKTNYPNYPWWRTALRMYLIGVPGYQNNFASWLWLGYLYTVALEKSNLSQKSTETYRKISQKIEDYQIIYEIYTPQGQPYNGWY